MPATTMSLVRALACRDEITQAEEDVAQVAIEWFANWLRHKAEAELIDGDSAGAETLIKTAYALQNME
jgi:hypothetical protein